MLLSLFIFQIIYGYLPRDELIESWSELAGCLTLRLFYFNRSTFIRLQFSLSGSTLIASWEMRIDRIFGALPNKYLLDPPQPGIIDLRAQGQENGMNFYRRPCTRKLTRSRRSADGTCLVQVTADNLIETIVLYVDLLRNSFKTAHEPSSCQTRRSPGE